VSNGYYGSCLHCYFNSLRTLKISGSNKAVTQYLKYVQRKHVAKETTVKVMASHDTLEAHQQATYDIDVTPTILSNLVAQVLSVSVGNVSQPPPAQAAMPVSLTAVCKTASYRLLLCVNCIMLSESVLDGDFNCWLAHLNGTSLDAPGMIDEGDTDDKDAVASDLQGMKLF
jgi:hypothetical protein